MDRRRTFAAMIRNRLDESRLDSEDGVREAAEDLEALACELENPELELEPACAVACLRMLSDLVESPFLNPGLGSSDLRSCVRQIRSGFHLGRARGRPCSRGCARNDLTPGAGRLQSHHALRAASRSDADLSQGK